MDAAPSGAPLKRYGSTGDLLALLASPGGIFEERTATDQAKKALWRSGWTPFYLYLWFISRILRFFFVTLPVFVCSSTPNSEALLSLAYLYIFLQALGMMWVLAVAILSVNAVQLVRCAGTACLSWNGEASLLQQIATGYAHYCLLRMMFFFGVSLYTVGWESFANFPTIRRVLQPVPKAASPLI